MTKEELKKEAEEWLSKNWTPYDFYDTECNVYNDDIKEDLIEGYLAGAEPRENKIADLEKENARLKAQLQKKINITTVSDYPYSALKLEEAKEIIRHLLLLPYANNEEVFADVTSILDKAEQFLKE